MYEITLDRLPPSVNHAYIIVANRGRVRRFKSKEASDYFQYIKEECNKQLGIVELLECPIKFNADVTFGDRRKRDLDNTQKVLLDAFSGVIWKDDSQVIEIHMTKTVGKNHGIKVKVEW